VIDFYAKEVQMPETYNEIVRDHFLHPRNMGEIEDADAIGEAGNPVCGDMMRLYLKIAGGVIVDAKFKTFGCGAAIAASSMATELIKGRTLEEALKISNEVVNEALGGLPPSKRHCSLLAEEALRAAMEDYRRREGVRNVGDKSKDHKES